MIKENFYHHNNRQIFLNFMELKGIEKRFVASTGHRCLRRLTKLTDSWSQQFVLISLVDQMTKIRSLAIVYVHSLANGNAVEKAVKMESVDS
jgi:hypothetical protein